MKNLCSVMAAVLLLITFTTACQEPQPAKMELSMYAYVDITDTTAYQNWNNLLNAFYAANPGVELAIEYGYNESYHTRLQEMVNTGQLPDLIYLWSNKRTGCVTGNGLVKDLRPFLAGEEGNFCPTAFIDQWMDGKLYELPESVTPTHVMYVNHRLLAELELTLPLTMAELIAQGTTIRANSLIPIAMDNGDSWEVQSCFASALVERMCGMEWFRKAITGAAHFSDPEFIAALQVIRDLAAANMFSPGINTAAYGAALTDFVNEEAVYYIDGGWRAFNMVSELSAQQKDYITLEVFPAIPGEKYPGATSASPGTGYGMNANLTGDKEAAAWAWIWFYSGPEGSKIRAASGALPAYKTVLESADTMLQKLNAFNAGTPGGYIIDAIMENAGVSSVLHPALKQLISGTKTATEVGTDYEAWVAANGSGR